MDGQPCIKKGIGNGPGADFFDRRVGLAHDDKPLIDPVPQDPGGIGPEIRMIIQGILKSRCHMGHGLGSVIGDERSELRIDPAFYAADTNAEIPAVSQTAPFQRIIDIFITTAHLHRGDGIIDLLRVQIPRNRRIHHIPPVIAPVIAAENALQLSPLIFLSSHADSLQGCHIEGRYASRLNGSREGPGDIDAHFNPACASKITHLPDRFIRVPVPGHKPPAGAQIIAAVDTGCNGAQE